MPYHVRHVVCRSSFASLASSDHAHCSRRTVGIRAGTALQNPSTDAAEIEALTAQIIPSTDSPGAREAHVIYFIDQALATFDKHKRDAYRDGLAAVQDKRRELFPSSQSIAGLSSEQQMSLLGAIERTQFFETLRTHTVMGFLANPEYGGNRNQIGWKHIGFQSSHHFTPPFGYYDQEENR